MFKKILVANRGEIACRIIRTARHLGIRTVAVYSDADQESLHVRMADEAISIGSAPSAESYLRADKIIEACRVTGAEAVHPGFGFLSENAEFAKSLADNGIVFIGPTPAAMAAMGDKIASKKLAEKAGVSIVPGHLAPLTSAEEAIHQAKIIGYPVMLKASAGGGGKGMRVAHNDQEIREGFRAAMVEALAAFGDDRVFIEKYIEEPRHIEIQVLADQHGNTVYLGERECSIQRRHQKVIEEAPSPFLDKVTREAMGQQAIILAKAAGYVSAGTVEFIVDRQRKFYFLEMNTRLQVEHAVTELVTGLDLVEQMFRIASGEEIPFRQKDIVIKGWAIEARLYAEDPVRGFMPSIGRLTHYLPPPPDLHIRIDTGVDEGSEISMFYDPMIAKVCGYGETREDAIIALRAALDGFYIRGVKHNANFLSSILTSSRFQAGKLTTGFIAEEYPEGFSEIVTQDKKDFFVAVAAVLHTLTYIKKPRTAKSSSEIFPIEWVVKLNNDYSPIKVAYNGENWKIFQQNRTHELVLDWARGNPVVSGSFDKMPFLIQVDCSGIGYILSAKGSKAEFVVLTPKVAELDKRMLIKQRPDTSKFLLAPMPGLLVHLLVRTGQDIKAGDELAVIEAMKMENVLRAMRDGIVKEIYVAQGDSLSVDQKIIEFA